MRAVSWSSLIVLRTSSGSPLIIPLCGITNLITSARVGKAAVGENVRNLQLLSSIRETRAPMRSRDDDDDDVDVIVVLATSAQRLMSEASVYASACGFRADEVGARRSSRAGEMSPA